MQAFAAVPHYAEAVPWNRLSSWLCPTEHRRPRLEAGARVRHRAGRWPRPRAVVALLAIAPFVGWWIAAAVRRDRGRMLLTARPADRRSATGPSSCSAARRALAILVVLAVGAALIGGERQPRAAVAGASRWRCRAARFRLAGGDRRRRHHGRWRCAGVVPRRRRSGRGRRPDPPDRERSRC